jgi:hypothetical protein
MLVLLSVLAVAAPPPINACAPPPATGSLADVEPSEPSPDTGLELEIELERIQEDLKRIREHLEAEDPERDQVERVEAPSG